MKTTFVVVTLTLVLVACGGDDDLSPEEACAQQASVFCDKSFECVDPEELNFDTAAECKSVLTAECSGTTETELCGAGFSLDGDVADECTEGLADASCAEIIALRNGEVTEEEIDEACGRVCVSSSSSALVAAPSRVTDHAVRACFGDE